MLVDSYEYYDEYYCPNCKCEALHYGLDYKYNYCPKCGIKIKWEIKGGITWGS